jgi:hypothetical protein
VGATLLPVDAGVVGLQLFTDILSQKGSLPRESSVCSSLRFYDISMKYDNPLKSRNFLELFSNNHVS